MQASTAYQESKNRPKVMEDWFNYVYWRIQSEVCRGARYIQVEVSNHAVASLHDDLKSNGYSVSYLENSKGSFLNIRW